MQNACGEASSSTDSDSKNVVCPTCGKDGFSSVQYMKVHHSHAHGESIAGVEVKCDNCGSDFRKTPSGVGDRNYCSEKCHGEARSELYKGENHPRYVEDKPELECEQCGETYTVIPANESKSRFCSMSCKGDYQSENVAKEDHPCWKGGKLEFECEWCGDPVERKPSHVPESGYVYCSVQCHKDHQSVYQRGENHHNYDGGRTTEYGPNWQEQRRKCIDRDENTCQACGTEQSKLESTIHVHHIKPRKRFMEDGVLDYEKANKLSNLVCLCRPCHQRWEGIPVKPGLK